jgi:hypothetical protein
MGIDPSLITAAWEHEFDLPFEDSRIYTYRWEVESEDFFIFDWKVHCIASFDNVWSDRVQIYPNKEADPDEYGMILQGLLDEIMPQIHAGFPSLPVMVRNKEIRFSDARADSRYLVPPYIEIDDQGILCPPFPPKEEDDKRRIFAVYAIEEIALAPLFKKFPQFKDIEKEGGSISKRNGVFVIQHPELDEPLEVSI